MTRAVTATVVATEIRAGCIAGVDAPLSGWWSWLATTEDPRHAQGTVGEDLAAWYLSRPIRSAPGTTWQYDEGLYDVLSYLVRKVDARGMRTAARDDLFAPLGIAAAASRWPVDNRANAYGAAGLLAADSTSSPCPTASSWSRRAPTRTCRPSGSRRSSRSCATT